ncbi:MAG TPA: tRNA-(ms[2]io[6]A)-hydroxylase [Bacteroidia bacterium]|nr:tRNA-(ms[2]io[6]A)-hydroxylase [Bacteroidia bacterium]
MLGLKLPTDPRWVRIAENSLEDILTDHAYCEQKAASNAISIVISYPYHSELVEEMLKLAKEELEHFEMVHKKLLEKGFKLGFERKDPYVNDLYKYMRKGFSREIALIDRLLFAAMIEARSCERFKLLSEKLHDADLRAFYRELMVSEANHYTTFLAFARHYGEGVEDVNQRWQEWLEHEALVIQSYGRTETIHG